jgi:hypothetical protein
MVADVYLELRELILRGDPYARGWTPSAELPHVWGALVEVGLAAGPATLVALRDGTTSLYLGNGGATIGAGAAGVVAEGTRRLLTAVEGALANFAHIWEFPVPEPGRVRMVALTYGGAMGADAGQGELEDDRHPLAAVFTVSGAVLADIERLQAAMPDSGDSESLASRQRLPLG